MTYPCQSCNRDEGSPVCLNDSRCEGRSVTGLASRDISEAKWIKYRKQRDDWEREQAATGPRLADVAPADFDAWCASLWRLIDAYRRGEGWPVSCRDRIKAHLAKCPGRPAA
jgi:hypothetical protein